MFTGNCLYTLNDNTQHLTIVLFIEFLVIKSELLIKIAFQFIMFVSIK